MKLRATITLDFDADNFREAAAKSDIIEAAVARLREDGFDAVNLDIRDRRDREKRSDAPRFRPTATS